MITRLLSLLPLLLCPVLMAVCMWAMRGMGNRETPKQQARSGQDKLAAAARIAQLEDELAELRAQLPQSEAAAPTPAPPDSSPATADRAAGRVDQPAMIPMPPGTAGDA